MKYELLQEGQTLQAGDEIYLNKWCAVDPCAWGLSSVQNDSPPYRRFLSTKPKVSLEEFKVFLYELLRHSSSLSNGSSVVLEQYAKDICARLGIELYQNNEEWERAFEQLLGDAGKDKDIPHIKAWCKAMFEAGQACEKSKEK